MNGVVRRVDPKKVDDEFVLNGRLGDLTVEFVPGQTGRGNGNDLWLGTNGFEEQGAWVSLEGLKSLIAKLERRAARA